MRIQLIAFPYKEAYENQMSKDPLDPSGYYPMSYPCVGEGGAVPRSGSVAFQSLFGERGTRQLTYEVQRTALVHRHPSRTAASRPSAVWTLSGYEVTQRSVLSVLDSDMNGDVMRRVESSPMGGVYPKRIT